MARLTIVKPKIAILVIHVARLHIRSASKSLGFKGFHVLCSCNFHPNPNRSGRIQERPHIPPRAAWEWAGISQLTIGHAPSHNEAK